MHRNHFSPLCVGLACGLLALVGSAARADLIQWGYNWEPNPSVISASHGSGYLSLTDEPSKAASGNSNTIVTNIRAYSTASWSNPDVFSHASYTFTLSLKDLASQATGTLNFSGFFHGTLTANSANIANTFTSPMMQKLVLGANTYTVRMGTYTPPGPPGDSNSGSLNAYISVAPTNGNGHISGAPEPSTLLLAGLALPWLGLARWRKRKTNLA